MKIETKYNPGDNVYALSHKGIESLEILRIKIDGYNKGSNASDMTKTHSIMYSVTGFDELLDESKLFPTKEDLIKSL